MSETKHGNSTGSKKQASDNFTEYKRLRNMTDALITKAKKDTNLVSKSKLRKTQVVLKSYGKH